MNASMKNCKKSNKVSLEADKFFWEKQQETILKCAQKEKMNKLKVQVKFKDTVFVITLIVF